MNQQSISNYNKSIKVLTSESDQQRRSFLKWPISGFFKKKPQKKPSMSSSIDAIRAAARGVDIYYGLKTIFVQFAFAMTVAITVSSKGKHIGEINWNMFLVVVLIILDIISQVCLIKHWQKMRILAIESVTDVLPNSERYLG